MVKTLASHAEIRGSTPLGTTNLKTAGFMPGRLSLFILQYVKEIKYMALKKNSYDLTSGSVLKTLVRFFLPVAAGTVVQQLYNTADAFIVGRYVGTQALAAVGGSPAQINNLIIGAVVALTGGASVVVAHFYGAKDNSGVRKSSNSGIAGCTAIGLLVTFLGFFAAPAMLSFMKTPADTFDQACIYLKIIFLGTTFTTLYNMGSGILRAAGDSQRPFIYLLICAMANIVLDYVFVAIFNWGVTGAAIATIMSQFFSCVLVLVRMATTDEPYRIVLSHIRLDLFTFKRMLYLGIPSALQQIMYGVSNSAIQVAVNTLGTSMVAAWSLCGKIDGFYWALVSAMGTAVMGFVGQNYGAGKIDRIKKCFKVSAVITIAGTLICSIAILLLGPKILPFFDDDAEVVELAVFIMFQFVPFYFLWPCVEIPSGILRGAGDAVVPVVILGITVCAYRVVWIYTAFAWYHTIETLCLCYPISWALASIPLLIRYFKGKWDRIGRIPE